MGHFYDLEPKSRQDKFYAKLSRGWEKDYRIIDICGIIYLKINCQRYPLLVDLELVSRCNLKCLCVQQ